jgi:mannose-1-phosphate guanylyltransferase
MKAFLLAAGVGSRLRPLTDSVPKCMLEIDGRPMLDLWLERLRRCGVDEVLVNLHHLPDVVTAHLASRPSPVAVRTTFEPELLGSAGTLLANRAWIDDEEFFLVCNADNLTDFDLRRLVDFHRAGDAEASLALFNAEQPSACGIVELDADGRVTGFTEKPARPLGDLANAGMYVFRPSVLDLVETPPPADIGYHLLPRLVGRARGLRVGGYFRDIGTPDAYRLAREEWRAVA